MDKCQTEFNTLLSVERASFNSSSGEGEGKMEVDGDVAAAVDGTICFDLIYQQSMYSIV